MLVKHVDIDAQGLSWDRAASIKVPTPAPSTQGEQRGAMLVEFAPSPLCHLVLGRQEAVDEPPEGGADAAPAGGAGGAGVGRLAVLPGLLGGAGAGEVAGTTAADIVAVVGLLAHVGARVLVLEGDGGPLDLAVRVAGAAPPAVEARGAGGRHGRVGGDWRDGRGHAGGGGGWGCAEEVPCSSPAGVGVGVLGHRWVWLRDQKPRHDC